MTNQLSKCAVLTFLLVCGACASFPVHKVPTVTDMPNQASFAQKPSIYFAVRFLSDLTGGKQPPIENVAPLPRLRDVVTRVANESSLFSAQTFESFESQNADYILQIDLLNYGSGGAAYGAGFITGLTLYLIPSAVTDNYRLDAKLLNRGGEVLKTYSYEDGVRTWLGIWVLPVAGNTPQEAVDDVWGNMVRTLFRDVLRDGLMTYSLRDATARNG